MQITDKIKSQLGNWWEVFLPFIESEKWDSIFNFLKMQSSARRTIIPVSADLFKSFQLCDRHKVKAVIVLMDPYPTLKDGKIIANGIPLDCSNTKAAQPSLWYWWEGIEKSLGTEKIDPDMWQTTDLAYLLKEEGVLLLNSSLTTEKDKPGSHATVWKPFMEYFFKVLNENYKGLPIVLMGAQAQKYEKDINPMLHYVLKCEHPVAASYTNRQWDNKDCFNWINNIIKNNNGPSEMISWFKNRSKENTDFPEWVTSSKPPVKNENSNTGKSDLPWED